MIIKKLIRVCFLFTLIVLLTACNEVILPETPSTRPSTTEESTPPPVTPSTDSSLPGGSTPPSETVLPTTEPSRDAYKTTLPTDPNMEYPLITFSLDPNELTNEYVADLIQQADKLLTEYDNFYLNNYFGVNYLASYRIPIEAKYYGMTTPTDEYIVRIKDSVYHDKYYDYNLSSELGQRYVFDFFYEDPGYILIKSTEDTYMRIWQRYLVVMVMIYEKYADCLVDVDYVVSISNPFSSFRNAQVYVSTDFRESDCESMIDFFTEYRRSEENVANAFMLAYENHNIWMVGRNAFEYYGESIKEYDQKDYYTITLKTLGYPTIYDE